MKQIETIVRWMVANDFMSGWLGDKSEAFIQEQIEELQNATKPMLLVWLKGNRFNIGHLPEYKELLKTLE